MSHVLNIDSKLSSEVHKILNRNIWHKDANDNNDSDIGWYSKLKRGSEKDSDIGSKSYEIIQQWYLQVRPLSPVLTIPIAGCSHIFSTFGARFSLFCADALVHLPRYNIIYEREMSIQNLWVCTKIKILFGSKILSSSKISQCFSSYNNSRW